MKIKTFLKAEVIDDMTNFSTKELQMLTAYLDVFIKKGHLNIVKLLMVQESKKDKISLEEMLKLSCLHGQVEILNYLIESQNVSLTGNHINDYLYLAIENGHVAVARFLWQYAQEKKLFQYTDAKRKRNRPIKIAEIFYKINRNDTFDYDVINHPELFKFLAEHEVEVDDQNEDDVVSENTSLNEKLPSHLVFKLIEQGQIDIVKQQIDIILQELKSHPKNQPTEVTNFQIFNGHPHVEAALRFQENKKMLFHYFKCALKNEQFEIAGSLISFCETKLQKIILSLYEKNNYDALVWLMLQGITLDKFPKSWQKIVQDLPLSAELYQLVGLGKIHWGMVRKEQPLVNFLAYFPPYGYNENRFNAFRNFIALCCEFEGEHRIKPRKENYSLQDSEVVCKIAYKLSILFPDIEAFQAYVEKWYSGSQQPLHDAAMFELPKIGTWNIENWRNLIVKEGPRATKFLPFATQIEAFLGRSPRSIIEAEEVCHQAQTLKYTQHDSDKELAELCKKHLVTEEAFDASLDIVTHHSKKNDNLPDLVINGKDINCDSTYRLVKLDPRDKRGLILGKYLACCQSIGDAGGDCARDGMTSENSGFYVILKAPDTNKKVNIERLIESINTETSIDVIIKSIKDKKQRQKLEVTCADAKAVYQEKKFTFTMDEESYVKSKLTEILKAEVEEKIVAGTWALITKDNGIIFDSWERLRADNDKLCKPFLEAAARELINRGFKRVMLGTGGNTPEDQNFSQSPYPEVPKNYDPKKYRDSEQQYELAVELMAYFNWLSSSTYADMSDLQKNIDKKNFILAPVPVGGKKEKYLAWCVSQCKNILKDFFITKYRSSVLTLSSVINFSQQVYEKAMQVIGVDNPNQEAITFMQAMMRDCLENEINNYHKNPDKSFPYELPRLAYMQPKDIHDKFQFLKDIYRIALQKRLEITIKFNKNTEEVRKVYLIAGFKEEEYEEDIKKINSANATNVSARNNSHAFFGAKESIIADKAASDLSKDFTK